MASSIGLSSAVNLIALPIRLVTTCRILFSSASTTAGTVSSGPGGMSIVSTTFTDRARRDRNRARVAPANAIAPVALGSGCAGGRERRLRRHGPASGCGSTTTTDTTRSGEDAIASSAASLAIGTRSTGRSCNGRASSILASSSRSSTSAPIRIASFSMRSIA